MFFNCFNRNRSEGRNPSPSPKNRCLNSLALHVDYDEYPGAIVAGVARILIKCHGAFHNSGR